MAVTTNNKFGQISVSDDAVMMVANYAATECYGVVDLVSRRLTDSLAQLFRATPNTKGIRMTSDEHNIYIDAFVILKSGVAQNAVEESLKRIITYSVEYFTGMRVKDVVIYVVGVRV